MHRSFERTLAAGALLGFALLLPASASAQLAVVAHAPTLNATAPVTTSVSFEFDRAVDPSSIDDASFRVYGRWSGPLRGTFSFPDGGRVVTLTPNRPLSAGESVFVNLASSITAADTSTLRAAGYAFQFVTGVVPSDGVFRPIGEFGNRTDGQTRIYGASAADLDGDGWLDLATINEVSADVRVFMNRADGSGLYGPMLDPEPIGIQASPNEPADFDGDGIMDLAVSATTSATVTVLLGAGDGTFRSTQTIPVGSNPHGLAVLDVDGDGDLDLVGCNTGSNNLSLMLNDGNGNFSAPTFFDGGVNAEYGLAAADMNGDGITDLVVSGRTGNEVRTLLGNGDGTFTPAGPSQSTGGPTWVVALADIDGDGDLDVGAANNGAGTISILRSNGDGTFQPATVIPVGGHVPALDFGDLDGDGDPDLVASVYGTGSWRRFENDGDGNFTFVEDIPGISNPGCVVMLDFDNDGDLDLALIDEIADVVILMANSPASLCKPEPAECRTPAGARKSKLVLGGGAPDAQKFDWKWKRGAATDKAEFGDPLGGLLDLELCLYEDGELRRSLRLPSSTTCSTDACWRESTRGYSYASKTSQPDGLRKARLDGGAAGRARILAKGAGAFLALPELEELTGTVDVQLQRSGSSTCWGATFTPPHQHADASMLRAVSDAPASTTTTTTSTTTTTLPASWSAIHAGVITWTCAGCHGGSGGLSNLGTCDGAHAELVDVPSVQNPSMSRVEPEQPTLSWLMHKLDGTQGSFTADCVGGFCGGRMPLGSALSAAERNTIRTWIANGAVNDCP